MFQRIIVPLDGSERARQALHVHITSSVVNSLDTAFTLISIAETGEGEGLLRAIERSDLIALTTHGRSGPARWMLGSITERLLGATRLPLLVVHPRHPGVLQEEKEGVASKL